MNVGLENKVRQRIAALKAGNKELEAFSWSISHDLRAPLRHIGGYVDLLNNRFGESLLENAVTYTPYQDEAQNEIGYNRQPDHWEFFVRDNGVGCDMRYVHKLFGVFRRLHSPAQFEGNGIGLANVQRIVQKHRGKVRAESRPAEGADFLFYNTRKAFR